MNSCVFSSTPILSLTFAGEQSGPLSRHLAHRYHRVLSSPYLLIRHPPGLWLRHTTAQIFNPQLRSDTLTITAPLSSPWSSIVTVLSSWLLLCAPCSRPDHRCNLAYRRHRAWHEGGRSDVHHRRRNGEMPVQVGLLSADDRDVWSRVKSVSPFLFLPGRLTNCNRTIQLCFPFLCEIGTHSKLSASLCLLSPLTTGPLPLYLQIDVTMASTSLSILITMLPTCPSPNHPSLHQPHPLTSCLTNTLSVPRIRHSIVSLTNLCLSLWNPHCGIKHASRCHG